MDIKDIKTMLANAIEREYDDSSDIRELLMKYPNSDENTQISISILIVSNLTKNKVIPDNLDSDGDYYLAHILLKMYQMLDDFHLLLYGFVIIHHRFMFGDLLDKGEMADLAICYLTDKNISDVLIYFAENTKDDQLYNSFFEQDELSSAFTVESLQKELLRAMYPYVRWCHEKYPNIPSCAESYKVIEFFDSNQELFSNKKAALPKFNSFCRFLYEEIFN